MLPPLVADVNIASQVVQFLWSQGVDVVSACREGWGPYEDEDILAAAHAMNRFVLTHDSDEEADALRRVHGRKSRNSVRYALISVGVPKNMMRPDALCQRAWLIM